MANAIKLDGLITGREAARRMGVTPQWPRFLARTGKLPAVETPYGRLYREEDVLGWIRSRDAQNRSRKRTAQTA